MNESEKIKTIMKTKKIAVVTGSRADYGIIFTLLKLLQNDKDFELQLIVTGMHLLKKFGNTIDQIKNDGFQIAALVKMNITGAEGLDIGKAIGKATIKFTETFDKLKPDLIILQGDRFEMLAAATAALALNIPIAHIHGGEITEGLIDEQIRHSITKMSHLHFCSTELYRRRIIQMGEQPKYVFNVGAPGLDLIKQIRLLSKEELEKNLDFKFTDKTVLLTYHPVSLSREQTIQETEILFKFMQQTNFAWIITYPNADNFNDIVLKKIMEFSQTYKNGKIQIIKSLGSQRYFSVLKYVRFVIGNSSSGIIEAAMFKKPVIDIGIRQKGRLKPANIISIENVTITNLKKALQKISSIEFTNKLLKLKNPYGSGDSSKKIINTLKKIDSYDYLLTKKFWDIKV